MPDKIEQAKREKLIDLLRRATANGSHHEVAEGILLDWNPLIDVDHQGNITVLIGGKRR
jgi:hypothetical protein